ncbi:MAG: lytic transglycosylase domain-containing protein [Clostridia bacterium]|nr:lytic transglycosylase domain-containing protein [Clostridia bacterium]
MFRLIKFILTSVLWLIIFLFIAYCALCILFPVKYADEIREYSKKYDLDPGFVCAVINTESRFETSATSHKGARGLMQLMPETIDWAVEGMGIENFSYENIEKPEVNIEIGCWVLNFLSKQFNGNLELVAAAYNAGSGNVTKWLGDTKYSSDGEYLDYIPYAETANYVKKVMAYEKVYKIILRTDLYEIASN